MKASNGRNLWSPLLLSVVCVSGAYALTQTPLRTIPLRELSLVGEKTLSAQEIRALQVVVGGGYITSNNPDQLVGGYSPNFYTGANIPNAVNSGNVPNAMINGNMPPYNRADGIGRGYELPRPKNRLLPNE